MTLSRLLTNLALKILGIVLATMAVVTGLLWGLRSKEQANVQLLVQKQLAEDFVFNTRELHTLYEVASFGDAEYVIVLIEGRLTVVGREVEKIEADPATAELIGWEKIKTVYDRYLEVAQRVLNDTENEGYQQAFDYVSTDLQRELAAFEARVENISAERDKAIYLLKWGVLGGSLAAFTALGLAYRYLLRESVRLISVPVKILSRSANRALRENRPIRNKRTEIEELQILGDSLAAFANEMHQLVADRTTELTATNDALEKQMRRAQEYARQAREAEKAKADFLANMSHEIRTPMNGIIGMTNVLSETPLTEAQRRYVDTVSNCSESLLVLINDILDFSKIEAGKLDIESYSFDIFSAIEEVACLFGPTASRKGLELIVDNDGRLTESVRGDPHRLKQVLSNLVNNAIKFTTSGEVELGLRLNTDSKEEVVANIWVRDTGIGISEEERSRLFQPFSQADESTSRKFGGTGLGLAISQRLVELMDGEIGIVSEVGVGSKFWIRLALPRDDQEHFKLEDGKLERLKDRHVLIASQKRKRCTCLANGLEKVVASVECVEDWGSVESLLASAQGSGWAISDLVLDELCLSISDGKKLEVLAAQHGVRITLLATPQRSGSNLGNPKGVASVLAAPATPRRLIDSLLEDGTAEEKRSVRRGQTRTYPDARILLVDDNPSNRAVALELFRRYAIELELATGGGEAIEKVSENDYDLVFMDCMMPDLDGYTATSRIRSGKAGTRAKHVRIIALTANAMAGDKEKCLEAGMDDYLAKPIRPRSLEDKLDQWLGQVGRQEGGLDLDALMSEELEADFSDDEGEGVLFDIAELRDMFGDDVEVVRRLAQQFLDSLEETYSLLHDAIERDKDFEGARLHAHTIKGSSSNYGAERLRRVAHELENSCVANDWERAAENWNLLQSVVDATRDAVSHEIDTI